MSASAAGHQHHDHDLYASQKRFLQTCQNRQDPTRTKTIRNRFAQHLRARFDAIKAHVHRGIVKNDALGLRDTDRPRGLTADEFDVHVDIEDRLTPREGQFDFPRDVDTLEAFDDWLDEVLEEEILFKYEGENFLRQGAGRGITHADKQLRKAGIDVADEPVESILNVPVHRDKLELVFTRTFEELEGITEHAAQQLRRELADGLSQGLGPDEIARRINGNIDDIKRDRATVLARTEVIRSHSEFTLDRYEQIAGDIEVTIVAEFSTAGDDRVCEICQQLEGQTFSISEMRSSSFTPDGFEDRARSQFPVQPPVHPLCRCVILPEVRN